jgi:hypothetical protein
MMPVQAQKIPKGITVETIVVEKQLPSCSER